MTAGGIGRAGWYTRPYSPSLAAAPSDGRRRNAPKTTLATRRQKSFRPAPAAAFANTGATRAVIGRTRIETAGIDKTSAVTGDEQPHNHEGAASVTANGSTKKAAFRQMRSMQAAAGQILSLPTTRMAGSIDPSPFDHPLWRPHMIVRREKAHKPICCAYCPSSPYGRAYPTRRRQPAVSG